MKPTRKVATPKATDKVTQKGWFSKTQATQNGADIYINSRTGYPETLSYVGPDKPDFPDVKSMGDFEMIPVRKSKTYKKPHPETDYITTRTVSYNKEGRKVFHDQMILNEVARSGKVPVNF